MYRAVVGPSSNSSSSSSSMVVVVKMYTLRNAHDWWHLLNDHPIWQDRIFHLLSALYGIMGVVALIQLIRIELRVPEYGWTTQKVFHFLNFVVNGVRCLIFAFRRDIQYLKPEIVQHILIDVPSLAFFTTYALLVLFWAEIYYQARAVSTDCLRPTFLTVNAVIYAIQIGLWLVIWWKPVRVFVILAKIGVFIRCHGISAIWWKVGYVTSICFTCFLIRCVMMCCNAFNKAADLDLLEHPVLNFIYYMLVEILPSALVLLF
ncbi:hypothetical protein OSB04_022322 [Centaurea solstitialis]|uniref:THH1/TOM1/TOM3 domain-containing protein n=1 Tax=Centaurea solstitialis TaxID=347529 RepID=A0AA38SVX6_9ASTR|nr:hypothetical protein OSB04_022322 [Centaurea solstitialis]